MAFLHYIFHVFLARHAASWHIFPRSLAPARLAPKPSGRPPRWPVTTLLWPPHQPSAAASPSAARSVYTRNPVCTACVHLYTGFYPPPCGRALVIVIPPPPRKAPCPAGTGSLGGMDAPCSGASSGSRPTSDDSDGGDGCRVPAVAPWAAIPPGGALRRRLTAATGLDAWASVRRVRKRPRPEEGGPAGGGGGTAGGTASAGGGGAAVDAPPTSEDGEEGGSSDADLGVDGGGAVPEELPPGAEQLIFTGRKRAPKRKSRLARP